MEIMTNNLTFVIGCGLVAIGLLILLYLILLTRNVNELPDSDRDTFFGKLYYINFIGFFTAFLGLIVAVFGLIFS